MTDTRERFLRAISEHVPPEQISELFLFGTIRQSGVESGVAVIAAQQDIAHSDSSRVPPESDISRVLPESDKSDVPRPGPIEGPGAADDSWLTTDPPIERGTELPDDAATPPPSPAEPERSSDRSESRVTVYSARFRLVTRGIERGKWEFEITAEADAPAETVEEVVRGVSRRAGDPAEAERMNSGEVRAALAEASWVAAL